MGGADVPVRLGPVVIEIGRWVYGTVILLTVLVVYADDGSITFGESVGVVINPMLATFLAHLFAGVLAVLNRETGTFDRHELAELARGDAQYLLLTIPALIVLLVGALGAFSAATAVTVIIRGGVVLLVLIGALAGRRTGFGWWGTAACAAAAGALGLLELAAQVVLKT